MSLEVFTWHDSVHEAREGARIHFWRFAFTPDYDLTLISAGLKRVFDQVGIRSYIIYEMFGDYDVLVRLWAPRQLDPEDLSVAFDDELRALSLHRHDYVAVQATYLHWVWQEGPIERHEQARPAPDTVNTVSNDQVHELVRFNDAILHVAKEIAAEERSRGVLRERALPSAPGWLDDSVKRDLLRPISLDVHGMKFCVLFDQPRRHLRRGEREFIAERIRDVCISVAAEERRRRNAPDDVQLSMHFGTGSMTDYLIIGRAPDGDFYDFVRTLIFALYDLGLNRTYGMRTYTEVFADRNFAEFHDSPATVEAPVGPWMVELPESESLEFKATFELDVRAFLSGNSKNEEYVTDNVVKAVCGLLNAPNGGDLIIGVLELARELERWSPDEQPGVFQRISKDFPLIPATRSLEDVTPETRAIVGTDIDNPDGDVFRRKLDTKLRAKIRPSPLPFIDYRPLEVEGRKLMVVHVRPATSWYYVQTSKGREAYEFYVRESASTRAYSGPEADLYRRVYPRSGVE